jgi:hypothetical protein
MADLRLPPACPTTAPPRTGLGPGATRRRSRRRLVAALTACLGLTAGLLAALSPPALGLASLGTKTGGGATVNLVARAPGTLSNGCAYDRRGIPACGAYVGAAVGGNTDPASFESQIGRRLGVRRTYFGPTQVASAVSVAKGDLAKGRLPWISFKLPQSWARMASGAGDAWTVDLARRLAQLKGPVWVAFHHEPEGDGPIADWTRMQERLGPILRSNAPNAAFTVVTTGWNQLYGPSQYRLANIWPETKVDVAGFDVYSFAYTYKNGVLRTSPMHARRDYFEPFQRWASSVGTRWALAETGYTDLAARHDPDWVRQTYVELVATKGIGMAYFNSALNSTEPYTLGTAAKRADFAAALKGSPVLPPLS